MNADILHIFELPGSYLEYESPKIWLFLDIAELVISVPWVPDFWDRKWSSVKKSSDRNRTIDLKNVYPSADLKNHIRGGQKHVPP